MVPGYLKQYAQHRGTYSMAGVNLWQSYYCSIQNWVVRWSYSSFFFRAKLKCQVLSKRGNGNTCWRCCVWTACRCTRAPPNCRGWLLDDSRQQEDGERQTNGNCHTESHHKAVEMQLCTASMTASQGILVEHPSWKYNSGITAGFVGGGEKANGIDWKWWKSGERAGEQLAVREGRNKKNY